MIMINEKALMKLQSTLAQNGLYDKLFKLHEGKTFYLSAINDFMTGTKLINFNPDKKGLGSEVGQQIKHIESAIHVPYPLM